MTLLSMAFFVQSHMPAMPSSGPSTGRPLITSPFSAVQTPDAKLPTGHAHEGPGAMNARLSARLSSRSSSQSVPSLPKPMTPAMIEEAATAKQRSRQSKTCACSLGNKYKLHANKQPGNHLSRSLHWLQPCIVVSKGFRACLIEKAFPCRSKAA